MANDPTALEQAAWTAVKQYFSQLEVQHKLLCETIAALEATGVFTAEYGPQEWQAMLADESSKALLQSCLQDKPSKLHLPPWASTVLRRFSGRKTGNRSTFSI